MAEPAGGKLERFLEELPEEFGYGIRERLEVQRVLVGLSAHGAVPADPEKLKTLLAPILCSSREQQLEFYRRFDELYAPAGPAGGGGGTGGGGGGGGTSDRGKWARVAVTALALAVIAAGAAAAWQRFFGAVELLEIKVWTPPPQEGCVGTQCPSDLAGEVFARGGVPIGGADVWIAGQHRTTDENGRFSFAGGGANATLVLAAHPQYAALSVRVKAGERPRLLLSRALEQTPAAPGPVSRTGALSRSLRDATRVAISPAGDFVASIGADKAVRVHEISSGREVKKIEGPARLISFFGEEQLAIARDNSIEIVQYPEWRLVRTLPATKDELLRFMTYGVGPQMVASIPLFETGPGPRVQGIAFSGDFVVLHREGQPITVWDGFGQRAEPAPAADWPRSPSAFALSSNGELRIAALDRSLPAKLDPLRWVAAVLPLVAAALWLWWLWKTRSHLNRFQFDRKMDTHDLAPPAPAAPFRDRRAQELAKEMRRRKPAPVFALAAEPTVVGTARSAGLFTPVFTAPTRQREFLWLVDRAGGGDQQLEFFTQLAEALKHHGAFIEIYTFRRTPDQLRDSASAGWIDLKEAAARHPEHDVWVLADPAELLRSAQGQAPEWIRDLGRWQDAAILSTAPVDAETRSLLEGEGVRTERASVEGMIAMIQGEAKGAGTGAPYPRPLRLIPMRWVENAPQDEREEETMMHATRAYLGADGMLLAGACSIYPETFWEMTLWLAQKLLPSSGGPRQMDETLARLTSLPWFRYGRIPDWMRARLIDELGRREPDVRKLVDDYLTKTEKRKGALRIAKGKRGQEGPVRDYILFSFLLGRRVDRKLAVKPPSAWLRLVFEGGRLEFGPRVWIHALGTAALCGLAWVGADFAMRHVPVQLEVSTWKLPGAAARSRFTRGFPNDPMQRAMMAVAEAAVGTPVRTLLRETGQSSFERAVAARAALFVTGSERPPVARSRLTVEAGRVLKGGVVASLAGGTATVIQPEGDTVQLAKVSATNQLAVSYSASLVNPADGLTYVWIPPGEFLMGCSPGDSECSDDEKPAHPVRITKGFWMSESEVTQAAYQKVIGSNPSNFKGADLPVEEVNWDEAAAYCKAVGGRLPTEAEWEYAARGGDSRARYGELKQIAWYNENSGSKTHPVKGLLPNRFGLYDMLGNVWEWNADWYGPYRAGAQIDPKGPATGTSHVLRGGSWVFDSRGSRASNRDRLVPGGRNYGYGFRCARD